MSQFYIFNMYCETSWNHFSLLSLLWPNSEQKELQPSCQGNLPTNSFSNHLQTLILRQDQKIDLSFLVNETMKQCQTGLLDVKSKDK